LAFSAIKAASDWPEFLLSGGTEMFMRWFMSLSVPQSPRPASLRHERVGVVSFEPRGQVDGSGERDNRPAGGARQYI
jgi:hypothetical protein